MSKAIDRMLGIGQIAHAKLLGLLSATTEFVSTTRQQGSEPEMYREGEMIAVLLLCMVKHAKRCHRQQAGR
jgi:hypothetical protein